MKPPWRCPTLAPRLIAGVLAAAASATIALAAPQQTSPLSPQQALPSFHFADKNLTIELVASEPEVVSPVAIAWDADERLFVAEMFDYPNATNGGRIKLLEDRDGDGRYERATVFAEGLRFPNGVLPWNGGLLVTAAPDIVFLKDNHGDGRADEKRVLLTGFAEGNQQLRVNGLFWGIDNWVYGANGRSDGEIRRPDDGPAKAVSLRGHDFRFQPDSGRLEAIAGRSQFGATRDDWGNRFLSWNTIPIRHEVLPERYLNRSPSLTGAESLLDILSPGDDGRVFPLAPPPLVFNNESSSHFNALAGLTIYRGGALGEKYQGNAFVGESLRNLVHRRVLLPEGVSFIAKRGESEREFLASDDPWFHPVNFATGPDGALYVVDFYRRFVEHPGFVPGNLRGQIDWRTGADHGRIWRIRPTATSHVRKTKPPLSRAAIDELIFELSNPNAWRRDTAQRLLVERRDPAAVPLLKRLARDQKPLSPVARLGALWTLEALGGLDDTTLLSALRDPEPGIREHALRLAEPRLNTKTVLPKALCALKDDPSPRVRFQLALSLGEWKSDERIEVLARLAQRDSASHWVGSAILSSCAQKSSLLFQKLSQLDPHWLTAPSSDQARMLDRLGRLVGSHHNDEEVAGCLKLFSESASATTGHLPFLAGLADGLPRSSSSFFKLVTGPPGVTSDSRQAIAGWRDLAASTAGASSISTDRRLQSIRILSRLKPEFAGPVLLGLLEAHQPAEIQAASAEALVGLADRELAEKLFANWKQYAPATRRHLLALASRSDAIVMAMLQAFEFSDTLADDLDPSTRGSLARIQNPDLASRLKRFVADSPPGSRDDVIKRFEPALSLKGDPSHGAATFVKLCLPCHAIAGKGNRVGPDLSGIVTRPREAVLVDILDPSRQVTPDFIGYTVTTIQGETESGLISAETPNSITLRRPAQADETILRSNITGLRADSKSLMPDGLEQGLTMQDMADLLEFLQKPDNKLLPETNER